MTAFLPLFMLLSAVGLALSVASHLAALTGLPIPGGDLVWGLHIGIFVVAVPMIVVANRMARHGKRSEIWKIALSGCPTWARNALYALVAYAVLNFTLGMINKPESPDGSHALDVTTAVRLFSGHWMVFYALALAILYSASRSPRLLQNLNCIQGHVVGPFDKFCSKCGAVLEQGQPE